MPDILIATDASHVLDDIVAAIAGGNTQLRHVTRGQDVRAAVQAKTPDLLISDLQIGSMGGVAVTTDLRLEEGADRLPRVPVLLLLDRAADVFLARRSTADGWLVKPLDALRIERAVAAVLAGTGLFEGVDPSEWPALAAFARGDDPPEPVAEVADTETDDTETEEAETVS